MNNKTENTGKSSGRRTGPLMGIVIAGIVAVVAFVLFKNNAGPPRSNEQKVTSALPQQSDAAPGTKSSPAVDARSSKSAAGGTPVSDLITQFKAQLKQPNASLAEKKKVVIELAKTCSPEALAALKAAFTDGSGEIRQMIAESLGECSSPDAENLLVSLLKDPDEAVAGAAVRALAQLGTGEAVSALNALLNSADASAGLRADAALGLGQINQPGVMDMLAQAAHQIQDEDIVSAVLHAMGGRDFAETQAFFQSYLHSPDISSDLRVAAVEALASAQGDPTAFLADLASDPDADVRVAVAWALSATEATGNAGAQLVALLQSETDPDVRLRMYQALRNQEDFDIPTVLGLVQNEKDPGALVAGLDLLAKTVRDKPTDALQKYFNDVAIPELKQIALSPDTLDNRQAAILALTRSRLPAAQAALADIGTQLAQTAPPPKK